MKKIFNVIVVISFGLLVNCTEDKLDIYGYGTITGRVVAANSFEPIENSKVSISPTNNTVFTDVDGYFIIPDVEEGEYSVSAEKEEYLTSFEPVTVSAETQVNVIFEMEDDNYLNRPPETPVLDSPADAAENQETSVELIWSSSDPEDDVITYRVELRNDFDESIIAVSELLDTTYTVSDLKYGVKYFWQVGASDNVNPEVLSAVGSFKVKINPENRYLYVKKHTNNNSIIYSSNFGDSNEIETSEIQLTSEDLNCWRPRKNQAADLIGFLRTVDNETHVFTMNPNGSDIKQVTKGVPVNGHNLNEIDFAWSSNGDRFIYPSYNKLYVINKDGSGLQQLFETEDGSFITECDWSNDETIIAIKTNDRYGFNSKIYTINAAGNIVHTILENVKGAAGGLNISVDNKFLLYTHDVSEYENENNRRLDNRIYLFNLSEDTSIDLSTGKANGTIDIDPRFSPNESELIFVNTSNDGLSVKTIYKLSISDNNSRQELFQNAFMPDWE